MTEQDEIAERALAYPYPVPARSFLQVGDRTEELQENELRLEGRRALLALGSNAAPAVLARKLASAAAPDPVPVIRATLSDFDVVYSAHISAYGSIPAAIQVSPGTEALVYVLYVTGDQLKQMSETEPNYRLAWLRGVSCRLELGERLTSVAAYVSRHGCLTADGSEVALESVTARSRKLQSMSERQVLEYVRSVVGSDRSIKQFIEENVRNEELARERTSVLKRTAKSLSWPDTSFLTV